MLRVDIDKYCYHPSTPLKRVIHDLYQHKIDICLVCSEDRVLQGILTLSDIKKAIAQGVDPGAPISITMNREFVTARESDGETHWHALANQKNKFGTGSIEKVPILDQQGRLKGLYASAETGETPPPRTVLVTGGAGYLGSVLCRQLLARGFNVVVLDKLMYGVEPVQELLSHPHFRLAAGNINNLNDLIHATKESDYVVHLAAIVGDPASALDPVHTMEVNHFSTHTLIEVAKHFQISRFIFTSSCSVYGRGNDTLDEESEASPTSLYARTKVSSEQSLLTAADPYFHPTILRLSTLYGLSPRMRFDLVANIMTARAHHEKQITVHGGTQWRPLLHVEDAARAIIAVLEAPLERVDRQIFNVGADDQNFTIAHIAKKIIELGVPASIVYADSHDPRDYRISFQKIRQSLNFTLEKKLEDGIIELYEKLKQNTFSDFMDQKYHNVYFNNFTSLPGHRDPLYVAPGVY